MAEYTTAQERAAWQRHARYLLQQKSKQVPTFHPEKVDRLIVHLGAALEALVATNTTGRCDECSQRIRDSKDEWIDRFCACRRHRPCGHRVWRNCPVCAVLGDPE